MHIMKKEYSEATFMFIVKKCSFLHLFVHEAAKSDYSLEPVAELIHYYASEMTNKDIPVVMGLIPAQQEQK
jgi:hypothetical protein